MVYGIPDDGSRTRGSFHSLAVPGSPVTRPAGSPCWWREAAAGPGALAPLLTGHRSGGTRAGIRRSVLVKDW